MILLGIDPGATGGLAVVSTDVGRLPYIEEACRMPTVKVRSKTLVDSDELFKWLMAWPIDAAIIEWVHAMPRQGVSSSFSFGRSTGAVEAVAMLVTKRVEFVSSTQWKKHFGLSSSKQASIDLARRLFGKSYTWDKKADDGIAEASLMCRWFLDKQAR